MTQKIGNALGIFAMTTLTILVGVVIYITIFEG
jgi:hypothetical protein